MSVGAVIDLGFDRDAPMVDRPWPGWETLRGLGWRRLLGSALTVLVSLPLAAAAGPSAPRLVHLWTVPVAVEADAWFFGGHALDDRHLYQTSYTAAGGTLTAYRLEDGGVEWRVPLPGEAAPVSVSVSMIGDALAVVSYLASGTLTAAYDRRTGDLWWHRDGFPFYLGDGQVVLERDLVGTAPDADGQPRPRQELAVVDVATGRVGHVVRTGGNGRAQVAPVPDGGTELVTLDPDGWLRSHDLDTGEMVVAAELRVAADNAWLSLVDDLLFVNRPSTAAARSSVTAHHRGTLAERWTVTGVDWIMPCGPVLCAISYHASGQALRAIDPVTGAVRWSRECVRDADVPGDCQVSLAELAGGLWVQQEVSGWDAEAEQSRVTVRSWVVDPVTGREVDAMGPWRLAGQAEDPRFASVDWGGYAFGPGDPPRRIWLGRVGVDRSAEVLGEIEAHWWQPSGQYVVAWTYDAAQVWRVR